ncbi:CLUMA_CG008890, isoform A [Clunio marinus]|uniref:CLUMA_CG008890, isoform A n=1 Tax=Clunio marinus TaxID=568069 RepID=A0A1J1I4Q9_9DIPT|nr:CLUMA_CG008890, isoform A [Clunio marinus]
MFNVELEMAIIEISEHYEVIYNEVQASFVEYLVMSSIQQFKNLQFIDSNVNRKPNRKRFDSV